MFDGVRAGNVILIPDLGGVEHQFKVLAIDRSEAPRLSLILQELGPAEASRPAGFTMPAERGQVALREAKAQGLPRHVEGVKHAACGCPLNVKGDPEHGRNCGLVARGTRHPRAMCSDINGSPCANCEPAAYPDRYTNPSRQR